MTATFHAPNLKHVADYFDKRCAGALDAKRRYMNQRNSQRAIHMSEGEAAAYRACADFLRSLELGNTAELRTILSSVKLVGVDSAAISVIRMMRGL